MRGGLRLIRYTLALLVLLACPRFGAAQVLYGSLTGNVTDPAGAAVPGAHVEAVNSGTNIKFETNTDDRGVYRFTDLQIGLYKVTMTAKSFATFVETDVQVQG
ncbi:MAG TPA: carboxypeptidase-like regulatory domain-containing protein, partial [Bryobacteraceae bacterium]|nr:carboxypeptidase-like regulatory domain-containing protein [Bryobacteraceae bacterium]